MLGISWLAENILASQYKLCSMEESVGFVVFMLLAANTASANIYPQVDIEYCTQDCHK